MMFENDVTTKKKMEKKKNPFDDKQNFHEFSSCILIIEFASK